MESKRVLLVDTAVGRLQTLTHLLTRAGFAVTACEHFEDAREFLDRAMPDVLLTDLRLGAFNGLHLVIIAKAKHPRSHCIVYSELDDAFLRGEAERLGAYYLQAPFAMGDLITHLNEATGRTGKPTSASRSVPDGPRTIYSLLWH